MKKRLLAILLSATMLFGVFPIGTFAATEDDSDVMTFKVLEKTIDHGETTVTLPIEIENNPGLVGATFYINFDNDVLEVAYDEDTEIPDVSLGDGFGKLSIMPNESGKSPLKVVVYGSVNVKNDGTFVNVKFDVKDGAKPGKYTVSVETYGVKGNKADNKNETYAIEHKTVAGSVTIVGKEFNSKIKLSDDTAVYDGKAHSLKISGENLLPKDAEVKYFCDGEEFDGATEPDDYDITAVVSAPGYADKELNATLTIEKRTLTANLAVGSKEYDGTKSVTFTKKEITGIVEGDDVVCDVTAEAASADLGKNIKVNVEFSLTGDDKDKYNPPKAPSLTTTVTAREITVTANGSKKLGEDDPKLEPEITSGSLIDGDSFTGSPAREKGDTAGTYKTNVGTLKLSSNYKLTFIAGTFEIFDKPKQTITASINKTETVYGDKDDISVKLDIDEENSASDAKNNAVFSSSDKNVATIDGDGKIMVLGAGKTTVTVTISGGDDYADFKNSFELNVAKRKITVTAEEKTKYEEQNDPEFTYNITSGSIVDGDVDSFKVTLSRVTGEKAGKKYAIKLVSVSGGENYDITFVGANLEILKKLDRSYTLNAPKNAVYGDTELVWSITDKNESKIDGVTIKSSNSDVATVTADGKINVKGVGKTTISASFDGNEKYNDWKDSVTLNVAKRPITITVKDNSKKIDGEDPDLEYELDGSTANGDILTVFLERKKGEALGSYDINATYTLDNEKNYDVTVKKGTFTINEKLTQTITAPSKVELTYGDESIDFDPESSLDGVTVNVSVNDDNVVKYNADTKKLEIVGAGKTEITMTAEGNADYADASAKTTVTVAKAKLTVKVTADNESYTYGDDVSLSVKYDGFVYGETEEVLTKKAVMSDFNTSVGTHTVKVSGAAAANYELEYVPLTFTVNKAEVGLEKINLYNLKLSNTVGKNPEVDIIDYKLSGNIKKADDVKFTVKAELKETVSAAGTYYAKVTVTMSGADKGNYELKNGGKFGYDENIYSVEVLENYGAAEILAQAVACLVNDSDELFLEGNKQGIELPVVPDGYKIIVYDKENYLDETGYRIDNVDAVYDVIFTVEETNGNDNASLTKKTIIRPLKNFNVTVYAENGTVTGEGTYTVIDEITLEATPDSKYSFSHWEWEGKKISTVKKFTFKLNDVYDCEGDLELKAVFKKASSGGGGGGGGGGSSSSTAYTVKFEMNGASAMDSVKVDKNEKLAKPADPVREGFEFGGWFVDEKLENEYDFNAKVTEGITLYAKWTEIADKEPDKDDKDDSTDDNKDDKTDDKKDEEDYKNPYTDVNEDDWFADDVEYVTKKGLFNGMTITEFGPDETLTRGMIVTVLYRAEGEPENDGNSDFDDVDEDAYYAKAVAWARENGIVKGMSENEFAPMENVTREQIAAIIYNYAIYKGYDVSVGEDTNILSYEDFDEVSEYAVTALCYACGSGLIKGRTETTLNPAETATRAEAAAIFARFFSYLM